MSDSHSPVRVRMANLYCDHGHLAQGSPTDGRHVSMPATALLHLKPPRMSSRPLLPHLQSPILSLWGASSLICFLPARQIIYPLVL